MNNKKWTDLTPVDKKCFEENHTRENNYVRSQINSNSSILSNWLYGLNIAALGAAITLLSTKTVSVRTLHIWPFIISLIFCVSATGLEWSRFTSLNKKMSKAFYAFTNDSKNVSEYIDTIEKLDLPFREGVLVTRILGYSFLFFGIICLAFSL